MTTHIHRPTTKIARQLSAIRNYNTLLMTRFLKQPDRRQAMDDFVANYRIKHPRFQLIK